MEFVYNLLKHEDLNIVDKNSIIICTNDIENVLKKIKNLKITNFKKIEEQMYLIQFNFYICKICNKFLNNDRQYCNNYYCPKMNFL